MEPALNTKQIQEVQWLFFMRYMEVYALATAMTKIEHLSKTNELD